MKRLVLAVLAMITISAGLNAQTKVKESQVPRQVLLAMENTYTTYSVQAWFEQPGQYVADFTTEGQKGKAYFTVRRDLKYEGFRTHFVHKQPTYQCNVILPYKSVFVNENCEIYEYQHFNKTDFKQ